MPNKNEEKNAKDKPRARTPLALLLFLIIVVFATLAYFLLMPQYMHLADTRSKIVSEKQTLDEETNTLAATNKLLKNYGDISPADEAKINVMLPTTADEPGIFSLFEFLAGRNKLSVLALDISEKEAAEDLKNLGVTQVQVAINLAASPGSKDQYGDFKRFLADLEANMRLMDVISINYSPESSSYILNVNTYRVGSAMASVTP
jgi:cell division protein FtsB